MELSDETREYIRFKLGQARESIAEAKGLLADGAGLPFIINSVYYGFYYPILGMLKAKGYPASLQSVSLALFEKEFRVSGLFEAATFYAIRKAFELKPKCSGDAVAVITLQDVESLINESERFVTCVSSIAGLS